MAPLFLTTDQWRVRVDTQNFERPFVIKNWHVTLTLLMLLLGAVSSYSTLNSRVSEGERRISDLERRPGISPELYQSGQEALKLRLDRIERKLDEETFTRKK